jgi:hypothetical protein
MVVANLEWPYHGTCETERSKTMSHIFPHTDARYCLVCSTASTFDVCRVLDRHDCWDTLHVPWHIPSAWTTELTIFCPGGSWCTLCCSLSCPTGAYNGGGCPCIVAAASTVHKNLLPIQVMWHPVAQCQFCYPNNEPLVLAHCYADLPMHTMGECASASFSYWCNSSTGCATCHCIYIQQYTYQCTVLLAACMDANFPSIQPLEFTWYPILQSVDSLIGALSCAPHNF